MKNYLSLSIILILLMGCKKEALIANYPLNGNLNDYAQAHLATPTGVVNFVKTKNTKGLKYSSKKELSFLELPDVSLNSKEYSISFFINISDFKRNNTFVFYGDNKETWGSSGLWLYTDKNKITAVQEKQVLSKKDYSFTSKENSKSFKDSKLLKENIDYFVVVTYKDNILKIFIDGNQYAEYINVKPFIDKKRRVLIGVANDPKIKGKFQLDGIIDEIKIYNKALTSEEVNKNFLSYQKK